MKKITLLITLLTVNFSLAQIVAPWGQDFNTIEAGGDNSAITDGWNQWVAAEYETNGTDIWYGWALNPNLAPGSNGEYTLYHDDDVPDTGVVDNYFITPVLDCTQLTEPALRFTEWGTWQSYYYFHGVYYSEDYNGTNAETATWVELAQGAAPTAPTNVEFSIPSSTTAIAWRYGGNYADNWHIDNIEVGEAGGGSDDCPTPQVTSWTMTGDGASFDGNNQSEIIGYEIHYSTSNFTLGDDTVNVYEFDSFPHTMTGILDPGTTYYMTIRAVCGDDDYSDWEQNPNNNGNGPDVFTTSNCPSSYSLPYLNDFNDPESWTNCQTFYDNDGDGQYWFYTSLDGSDNLSANSYSWNNAILTPDNWVIMGPIDLTNVSDALLEWEVQGIDTNYCNENYSIYVGPSNDYNDLINNSYVSYTETLESGGDSCGAWADRSLDISAATGDLVYIGMRHHDVTDVYLLSIDNVSVTSSTMSNEDFTLENINYTFNLESKILNVNSQEILSNIEIYNVLGQQVLIENLDKSSINLDLSNLSSGVYIVNVEGNNSKTKTFKLAIK